MDSIFHAGNSQPLSENRHFKSFQASSVSRRMEMRNKDLGSTFPELKSDSDCRMNKLSELWMYVHTKRQQVPRLECRDHFNICLQELVKTMEEMEKAIIKEKNEILEESKQIIEQDKIIEDMQKKVNEFLGVQSLKLVEFQQDKTANGCTSSSAPSLDMVKKTKKSAYDYLKKIYSCTRYCLLLFSRPLKFSVCYFIELLFFYKSLPVLAWMCFQLNSIYWHYLPCEYPY